MPQAKPLLQQLIIVGGLLVFLYIFFALTTAVYRDYQLEQNIKAFEDEIAGLAELADQKPRNVAYYQSEEYKDKYAKESLNLLNPGEKLIIIPGEDRIVRSEVVLDRPIYSNVLELPTHNQWWEYYFGRTLSYNARPARPEPTPTPAPVDRESTEPAES